MSALWGWHQYWSRQNYRRYQLAPAYHLVPSMAVGEEQALRVQKVFKPDCSYGALF
jgi:hypothetical protein